MIGSFCKYLYGSTLDYNSANEDLKEVKSKGYSFAYKIEFRVGKKNSVKEAVK